MALYVQIEPAVRAVQLEQAWCGEAPLQSDQRSVTRGSEGVGMSMVHRLRGTIRRSGRARKHNSYKAKGNPRQSSVCRESQAVCHTGQWTGGPGEGRTVLTSPKKQILFSQGEAAESVFYIQTGQVKLTVLSTQGKEAVVAMLERGTFFGGILPCRTNGSYRDRDCRGRLPTCAHRQKCHDPSAS